MMSNKKPRLDTLNPAPQLPLALNSAPQAPQSSSDSRTYTVDPTNGIFSATNRIGHKSTLDRIKNKYYPANQLYSLFDLQNSYKQLLDKMGELTLSTQYYNTSNIKKEIHNYKTSLELLFIKVVKKLSSIDRPVNQFEYNEIEIMKTNLGVLWENANGKLSTPFVFTSYKIRGGKNKSKKSKKSIMYKKNKKSRKH